MSKRTVYFISDQTGLTAETIGRSLLTQFNVPDFDCSTLSFIDSYDKAVDVGKQIDNIASISGMKPIVFISFAKKELSQEILKSNGLVIDFFGEFIGALSDELGIEPTFQQGTAHGIADFKSYDRRIDAMNFAMDADDGHTLKNYDTADIILIGVSRSGKTPTCLYLALQYGIYAANYPLSDDDLESGNMPEVLKHFRSKIYGLTISPERLRKIRLERRPDGIYSSHQQVTYEIRAAELLMKKNNISFTDTTLFSIEEIASTILSKSDIKRRAL
ncbi:MAG: hypothetical protein CBC38_07035 [Gammaproteobacteria bacterium TMED78]|nr:MAG: hypothetical protein CBC38_07035 [Gammaproteobacteria bacterium TMED78]|tara:strand:+ start:7398 stop:8219 length:822 start_codon:yes stop_codon:yes gene_type:complete